MHVNRCKDVHPVGTLTAPACLGLVDKDSSEKRNECYKSVTRRFHVGCEIIDILLP